MSDPRYPIGRYEKETTMDAARRADLILEIEALPRTLRSAVEVLTPEQRETPYREGGWTPREVVHHIADSHMNAFIRYRLALTEDTPTIKPYKEALWAQLPDSATPLEVSLQLIEALHQRWVDMLRGLDAAQLSREFYHPEHDRNISLDETLGLYAWHGRHHVAHIRSAQARASA